MKDLIRKDSLIIQSAISGIEDVSTIATLVMLMDTGDYKEITAPPSLIDIVFEWTPEETAKLPLRQIRLRLIVEFVDGRRFTIAESSIRVLKEFKEERE